MREPKDLAELNLARDELNVFVIGPGYGEVIVVDLPGPGWIVIDGAGRSPGGRAEFPAHTLLEQHLGDDFIAAMLLTHPHRDHYRGMRELIDHELLGPRLRRLGCVARLVEGDASSDSHAADVRNDVGGARALLERIHSWWASHPEGRLSLVRGPLDLPELEVQVEVLAPNQETIDTFLEPHGRGRRLRNRANDLSVVLELGFGEGRYLFTGDLSAAQWEPLVCESPHLHEHDLLKLPHHGSEQDQAQELLRARSDKSRTWVLTPFNRGSRPSRPPTHSGLASLLDHNSPLHLTAFPTAWTQTRPAPAQVELSDLELAPVRLRGLTPRGRGLRRRGVDPTLRMDDCYWLFCFDAQGQLCRSERGRVATRVTRDRPAAPRPQL